MEKQKQLAQCLEIRKHLAEIFTFDTALENDLLYNQLNEVLETVESIETMWKEINDA